MFLSGKKKKKYMKNQTEPLNVLSAGEKSKSTWWTHVYSLNIAKFIYENQILISSF